MKHLSYECLTKAIEELENDIIIFEKDAESGWPEELITLKAERDKRDATQAEGRLHRKSITIAHECIQFLREEVECALSDDCPVTAANLTRCADCLESLWNASQQRADDSFEHGC